MHLADLANRQKINAFTTWGSGHEEPLHVFVIHDFVPR